MDQIIEVRNMIIEQAKKPENSLADDDIERIIIKFLDVRLSFKIINAKRIRSGKIRSNLVC